MMQAKAKQSALGSIHTTGLLSIFIIGLSYFVYQLWLGPVAPVIPGYSWRAHTRVIVIGNRCGG